MEFKKLPISPRIPQGFRLATFEEFNRNYSMLRKQDVLNGMEILRLLDSIVCDRQEFPIGDAWRWMDMLVVGQSPTRIPRNAKFLRKKLYLEVDLNDERRKAALRLSCLFGDIEAIYWLLPSESEIKSELEVYFEQNIEKEVTTYHPDFSKIVKILFRSVQIGEDEVARSLDYAVKYNEDPENAIAIVESVLDCWKARNLPLEAILDRQIKRVADMSMDTTEEAKRIGILSKLLSECSDPLNYESKVIRPNFAKLLWEATSRGYVRLVRALLGLGDTQIEDELSKSDKDGKTLLHYAVEWEVSEGPSNLEQVSELLFQIGKEFVKKVDKSGTSVLHLSSLAGRAELCEFLITEYELDIYEVDNSKENMLHYAARGEYGYKIVDLMGGESEDLIDGRNEIGLTPLHVAATKCNIELIWSVKCLLPLTLKKALKATDNAGRTPLHLAASEGDEETVKMFLMCGSDPFKRDVGGKSALHHAVTNKKGKDTAERIVKELLSHLKCDEQRALLLSISGAGIGTADQIEGLDTDLKEFMEDQKRKYMEDQISGVNVLEAAAKSGNSRLTWELLNRGGDIQLIKDKSALNFVTDTIEKFSQQGTEQPTLIDTLERNVLAECISAHFLNPYIKSPITVSISGGSGSGKSSLMNQIEAYLLIIAAQLAFQNLWNKEKFKGAKKISPSRKGNHMCHRIMKGVYNLLESDNHREFEDYIKPLPRKERLEMSLVYFLKINQQKYNAVYKSLAYMDFNQLMKEDEDKSVYDSQGQSLGAVPRILTVNFNVGNYRGRTEAWAGLAVKITKEIEGSMTWAQLLSTRCRNAWNRHREEFYLSIILPGVVLAFVGAWIAWAAWKYLERSGPSQLQNLKYGSVTATAIVIMWSVLGNVVSVFKPISTQMRGYFSSRDHSQQLGYQETVISDIKFLKEEIGKTPFFIFSLIAGEMCNSWWGLWKENVPGTRIPQYGSAPEGKLRIIAFVDDLDQCEDTVILEVLWAINLIFRVCEINVVLAMDKATIQTAYQKSSLVQDRDFVDKFISKIIQLPVNIPDPTDDEWVKFLDTELVVHENKSGKHSTEKESVRITHHVEKPLPKTQSEIDRVNTGELKVADQSKDIESGRCSIKCKGWCIPFLSDWLLARQKEIASCFQFIRFCRKSSQADAFLDDCKRILEQRMQQVRDTLMLSYTDEEAKAIHHLKSYSTGIQKLPREWKNYMNYHKFARNVVSNMAKARKISYHVGWEVEFVVWTFVCSQWKHEMNTLIEDWYKYADDSKDSNGEAKLKSSLKQIVAEYITQRKLEEQKREQLEEQARKQIVIVSNSTQSSSVGSVKKELERWEKLHECLENLHDVSLEGIHCFQHYRYHCDARNLVSKLYKPKKKPLTHKISSTYRLLSSRKG